MTLSDLIEEYIREIISDVNEIELKRSELATKFNCVPSQINYVMATRFVPELGFYVESRRGGGGYIKIIKTDLTKSKHIADIISKIGDKLSQSVIDIYLKEFIEYNILCKNEADLIKIAVSDMSLARINQLDRDYIRADIFKCLLVNIVK